MQKMTTAILALCLSFALTVPAMAADVQILGKKLQIIDTTPKNGKSKAVFVAKDSLIVKGAAGDPGLLDGSFRFFYVDTPANGSDMDLSLGSWDKNTDAIARYKNVTAPVGGDVKVAVIKPNKVLKVVAKDKGAVDISSPPGSGGVVVVVTVDNGNDLSQTRMCTLFSTGFGSQVIWKELGGGFIGHKLTVKNGVGVACPDDCTDGVLNGTETGVDCGGPTCSSCVPGQGCLVAGDCDSGVCTGNICQAPTCVDGVQNGSETDVDCGGACGATCALGDSCGGGGDCVSGSCPAGTCDCGTGKLHTFAHSSNGGGVFDSAEWGGGTQQFTYSPGCSVTIQNPNDNLDLVCTIAQPFAVVGSTGFASCFGTGGSDGNGCTVTGCPPAGIGSCCSVRPSCSAALNGSGSATYQVQCNG